MYSLQAVLSPNLTTHFYSCSATNIDVCHLVQKILYIGRNENCLVGIFLQKTGEDIFCAGHLPMRLAKA